MHCVLQGSEALVAPGKWVGGGAHTRRSARVHGSEGGGVQVRQQHGPYPVARLYINPSASPQPAPWAHLRQQAAAQDAKQGDECCVPHHVVHLPSH